MRELGIDFEQYEPEEEIVCGGSSCSHAPRHKNKYDERDETGECEECGERHVDCECKINQWEDDPDEEDEVWT